MRLKSHIRSQVDSWDGLCRKDRAMRVSFSIFQPPPIVAKRMPGEAGRDVTEAGSFCLRPVSLTETLSTTQAFRLAFSVLVRSSHLGMLGQMFRSTPKRRLPEYIMFDLHELNVTMEEHRFYVVELKHNHDEGDVEIVFREDEQSARFSERLIEHAPPLHQEEVVKAKIGDHEPFQRTPHAERIQIINDMLHAWRAHPVNPESEGARRLEAKLAARRAASRR